MYIPSKTNGQTLSATEFNQVPTELQALQTSSGQISSDSILNQTSIATSRYAANNFYIDSGAADAYVLTLASSFTNPVSNVAGEGYFVGMTIRFRAGNANTGASTVNVNGAGVKNLKQADGTTDLAAGDISTTQDSVFRYNGTSFVLATGSASETAKGIIEIATNAEVLAGTDTTRAITPAGLFAGLVNSKSSSNGHTFLPNGWLFQCGKTSSISGASSLAITFGTAFPTALVSLLVTSNRGATTNTNAPVVGNGSTTGFTIYNTDGATAEMYWQAIGY